MNKSNEKCSVIYNQEEKSISFADYEDGYNMPRGYSTSKRGIDKAWVLITQKFNDNTTFYGIAHLLHEAGVKCHTYCSMD